MTTNDMARCAMVPGAPFGRVIREWMDDQGVDPDPKSISIPPLQRLASDTGMDTEGLRKLKNGKRPVLGFDLADKIVTAIDPFLWRNDPELAEIYQSVDLSGLDRRRPCVAAA